MGGQPGREPLTKDIKPGHYYASREPMPLLWPGIASAPENHISSIPSHPQPSRATTRHYVPPTSTSLSADNKVSVRRVVILSFCALTIKITMRTGLELDRRLHNQELHTAINFSHIVLRLKSNSAFEINEQLLLRVSLKRY